MFLRTVLVSFVVAVVLSGCQTARSRAPYLQLQLDVEQRQVEDLIRYITDLDHQPTTIHQSAPLVLAGLREYSQQQAPQSAFTLRLRPDDPDGADGSIAWFYTDQHGKQQTTRHELPREQVQGLWDLLQAWQQEHA